MYNTIDQKKAELDQFRPLSSELVLNLEDWFRVELTYTSNALEGNTLTRQETLLVVEKGITVGGKSLQEHLEATNHDEALDYIHKIAQKKSKKICLSDLFQIHQTILKGIDDDNTGKYRNMAARIAGSRVILPNPRKIPDLMDGFIHWLQKSSKIHPAKLAAEAHYRLVTIHPFVDGNGRSARLLMNLILIMHGYPPAIISKRDRLSYLNSLEKAQLGGSLDDYHALITKCIERSLEIYLKALKGTGEKFVQPTQKLIKIGELAKRAKATVPTIRHWTKLGLIRASEVTDSGYFLYEDAVLKKIDEIKRLKEKRFTLKEIKNQLNDF
ncbi:MAG: hypothetical protein S4CHLAM7_07200 [Chlamydiae bacterium]|nr:hypothetical protein [Chlamydiota bacterium]